MQDSNIQTDPMYQPDDFQFKPIDEMFDLDFDVESVQGMGDYMKDLESLAPKMNQFAMPLDLPMSRHNSPKPGFDNFESFKKAFNAPTPFLGGEQQMKIQDPIISGIKSSGYDRYARMDAFDRLGFRPDMDMESYYNANTTGWDDFKRHWGPWLTNFTAGIMSSFRSWGDLFSGDESYWTSADLEGATAMSEANRLGASTRGGVTGFLINLNLNAAQTLGTISEILAEELVLAGATAATEGGAAPVLIARTGKNFVKGIKSIGNLFDVTRTMRMGKDVLATLRTADKAKDFWSAAKTGGKLAGDFFTPELRATLKSFKSSESAARGLSNLAKTSKGFGAFYRDARALNLTMSESKLEAGFAYQDMFSENVERVMRENGGAQLTPDQLSEINEEALKAATNSVLFNAPAIFVTNKIVLGKALGGFSPQLRRIFNKVGNSKNIVRKTTVENFVKNRAAGKTAGKLFQETSNKTIFGKLVGWNQLKALGVKGSIKHTAGGILRYSAGGLGEGFQELYQEGVAQGLVGYHSSLLESPNANRHDLQKAAFQSGFNSQMTGQGFETFLSGFLMGGLVQGPQRLFFEVLPDYIQQKRDPKQYEEYKKQRDAFVDEVNDIAEEVAKDPQNFMSSSKLNFFAQKQSEDDGDKHMFEDDELGMRDSKDDSFIMNAHHMVTNGTEGLYIEQLEDLQKLSDEALIEAYPNQKEDIESGKFKERIGKSIDRIKNFKKEYDASFDVIQNPYAFKRFDKGTKEFNAELAKYSAVEHGRLLYLFSKESFKAAANRRDAIEQALKMSTVEGSTDVNDLTPLLAVDSIQREIALLSDEIKVLQDSENIDEKILSDKKNKLVALAGYLATLEGIYDKDSDVYDRDKMENLKTPLKSYIEAVSKGAMIDDVKLSYLVKQLVDHSYLDKRAQVYARSVSMFSDNVKFTEMSDRLSEIFLTRFNNIKSDFKKSVIKGIQNQERVSLLEALAGIGSENKNGGVYADTEQSVKFMETGDTSVLTDFYTEAGKVFKSNNNELYQKIQTLIDNYNRVKFETENADKKAEEEKTDVNQKDTSSNKTSELNEYLKLTAEDPIANIEEGIDILKENESPFSKLLLEDLYLKYKQKQQLGKKTILSKADWINTKEGTNAVAGLEKIKGIWLASESNKALSDQAKDNISKSEEGFQEWILDQKDDTFIYRSLEFAGLKAADVERNETNEGLDSVVENDPLMEWADKGPGVNILKKEIASIDSIDDEDASDLRETIYVLTDNNGNTVSGDLLELAALNKAAFTNFDEAVEAFDELKKLMPDTTPFNFDGTTLVNLDVVEDVDGNKFVVLGTSTSAKNAAKLELIALDKKDLEGKDKTLASFTVEEAGFSDIYTKVEETFEGVKLSTDAVKLLPGEVNGLYPKSFGLVDTDSKLRLNKVLSLLSPEEISALEIRIRPNPNQSSNFLKAGDDTTENKLIVKGDKYSIEVFIPEASREDLLNEMGNFYYSDDWDGSIGFIRNDHFRFTKNGNPKEIVKISQLEDKVIDRYITPTGVSVSELKNEMLKQDYFTLKIDEFMKDKTNAAINMADLEELGFTVKVTGGQYEDTANYDNSYDDLAQNTYDGHKVVIVNTRNVDSVGERFETDIEDPIENEAFIQKLIKDLESTPVAGGTSNMYQKALSKGGYVGIIKDPLTGKIVLARLAPRNLEAEERNVLFTELIEKAKEVRDSKNKEALFEWNKDFNNKFFSATNPTEKTYLDLQVSKSGDIVLRVKVGQKGALLTTSESFKASELDGLNPEDILTLYSLLNKNAKVVGYNKKSPNVLTFGESNLKTTFPLTSSLEQILSNTKTNLDSRVLKGVRVKLNTTDEMVKGLEMVQPSKPVDTQSDEYAQPVDKDVTLLEQKRAEELSQEDNSLQEMSDERYNEFKSNDFKDLPRSIKVAIVNKVVQDGRDSLDAREKEILKMNSDELELLIMSKSYQKPVKESKSLEEEIAEVEAAIKKEKKRIAAEAKRTGQHQATLRKNSELYVSLIDKLDELERRSTDESAFKILDPSESLQKEESIDEFLEWAAQNLPDFIKIKDLSEIKSRLKSTGTTVGQFTMALRNIAGGLNIEGTIYTGPSNGIGYHESFHAVFRMLLTTEEQNRLLKLAKDEVRKKFKTTEALQEDISRFANRHPKYRALSKQALEREYLEEYMADQFQAFKTNPRSTKTSSTIKSFFNRVVEWIKSVLKSFRKNELDLFYERIDAGKYRGGQILDNQYTRSLESGVALDAFKAIPYKIIRGDKLKSAKYLDPSKADILTRMIGQMFVLKRGQSDYSELQDEELLDTIIIDFADLYDSERDVYASLSDVELDTVEQLNEALNLQDGKAVKESVIQYLDILNLKFDEMDEQLEEDEDDYGSRKVGDYTKDANQTGGYNSATKEVRTFIAGVSIQSKDMFGNIELMDGTPIRVPVNHIDVYNGLMLAGMNETSDAKMLEKMYYFSRRNENTAAVIDELFRVTGIDINEFQETGQIPNTIDNAMLFNQFMTTFKNARFDYIFQLTDPDTGKVRIISASNRDAANAQIDYWKKLFNDKFEIFKNNNTSIREAVSGVNMLLKDLTNFSEKRTRITNKELGAKSLMYSKLINEQLGIKLSPLYIEISIANAISGKLTKYQETLKDIGGNARLLTKKDLVLIVNKLTGKEKGTFKPLPENLFIDDAEKGISSKLKQIALGNAEFDETVGNTVFEDPERNLIYAHQNQTLHSRKMIQLSDEEVIRKLQSEFPNNTLLNSEAFLELSASKQLQLIRTAGSNMLAENMESMDLQDADDLSRRSIQGKKYGKFTSVEFVTNLINNYFDGFNTKSNKVETAANVALAPVFIRIIESSNTGDSIRLPIIKSVKLSSDGKDVVLTPEAFDQFVNRLKTEYNVIQKNNQEYDLNGPGNIKGYNDSKNGRGFKFFKGAQLISEETQNELIKAAAEGKNFDDVFSKEYKTELNDKLKDYIKEFQDLASGKLEGISQHAKGIFPDTEAASNSMEKLNVFRKNEKANLAQIFISNWLNTMAINELILGEEAKLFKDAVIDPIKRAKMQNAAHDSIAFDFLPKDDSFGISHTLGDKSIGLFTFTDPSTEDGGDKADAQSYQTIKGARYSAFGLGSLNSDLAKMYDKIEAGESVDNEWFNNYLKKFPKHAPLNSKKYVFGNGQTFIKTSTVVLTKELTSYQNEEGVWVAKVGMERLHNLRENMERWESQNGDKISIGAPESAVKMLKQNVIDNESMTAETMVLNEEHVTLLDAKDFGRQMVNPSNKLLMTDPSQIKTIITSEQDVNDKDFKVVIDGVELPMADVVSEYHKLTAAGLDFEYFGKKNLIFDLIPHLDEEVLEQMNIEPNLYSFIRTAQANLKSSAASSKEIEFFTEEDGKPKYELNNPIISQKFEQFFMAYFSKKVLSQKIPGVTLALMSDFGVPVVREIYSFDEKGRPDKQRVIRRKNSNQYNGQKLLDITNAEDLQSAQQQLESDPSKPIVVLDRLRYDMKEYNMVNPNDPSTWVPTNVRYAETLMPAHHEEVMVHVENKNIKDISDAVSKMFAVRIPTQDKHSSMASKVVDFLPVYYGSTAIFPEDLIKISGADFDIDKVYAAIKEWHYQDGKFIEYGSRKGEEGYADYIKYTNKKVAEKGSNLNEAYSKYEDGGLSSEVKTKSLAEIKELLELGYTPEAIDGATMLGLPLTQKEYKDYIKDNGVEPYKATITNKLVDLKYTLVGNTKLTESKDGSVPLSYQPADIEAVKQVWQDLSERFDILKTYTKEEGIAIDNLIGQFYSHKNVKENSGLIGGVVPPATIINFLREMNISSEWFELQIDGKSYNKFANEIDSNGELQRTQYVLSNLITLATDDAKERLLSKLGYNKKGIKYVLSMVSFGVPLEQATMLVNVKAIRQALETENPVGEIKAIIKDLNSTGVKPERVTTKTLSEGIEGNEKPGALLGLLIEVLKADRLTKEVDNLQAIFQLNKGFGKDFSSLLSVDESIEKAGLYTSNSEMEDKIRTKELIFDLRNAFSTDLTKDKPVRHYIGQNIRVFEDFKRNVLPEVFTSQSPAFKRIFSGAMSYANVSFGPEGAKLKAQVQKDILSYFTIKAYIKDLFDREAGSLVGASLSNEFLYPSESSDFNITTVIKDLKSNFNVGDNYFLDYFVFAKTVNAEDNKTGMNIATTRSFGKLSDNEKVRIQNGFQALYGDVKTRKEAVNILHYIMAKDGLSLAAGSLLEAITPFGLEKYLSSSTEVFKAFKGQVEFEKVFGESLEDLSKDFINNYGRSAAFSKNIKLDYFVFNEDSGYKVNVDKNDKDILRVSRVEEEDGLPAIVFPKFISRETKNPIGVQKQYYTLVKGSNKNLEVPVDNIDGSVLTEGVYERFDLEGSYYQNAIGFIFDNDNFQRPKTKDLYVSDKFDSIDVNFNMDLIPDDTTMPDNIAELSSLNNLTRNATEKGIEVEGKNIADITQADIPGEVSEEVNDKLKAFISNQTKQGGGIEVVSRYTNADVKANPNKIYVFGDNLQRKGTGGQAQIRNNENAFGIRTKLKPSNTPDSFMTDKDLEKNMRAIDYDINTILKDGRNIVFPKDGFGTGLAKLKQKAPQTYSYLKQRLQEEFGFNNDTGVVSQSTQQTSDVKSENISSKGSKFAKKLTNPGNNLKVTYKGREFRNAEHAYQTYKSGEFDQKAYDSNAFKPVGSKPANRNTNYQTMVDILKAKLEQHPELIEGISQRGGLAYIEESTHNVTGDKFWESKGQNKFIEALADAYRSIQPTQQASKVDTITYTPKGKQRQTYTIRGSQIFNQKDQEVFAEDSIDRNKIFANLAVKQGRAVVVNYKGTDYIVNNKQDIMSTVSGKIMKWGPENGNRKGILAKVVKPKQQQTSEVIAIATVEDSIAVINEYSNSDIAKIVRNSNNEATDYLGKLISKTKQDVEGGNAEQEIYEYGTIQRIFADDGSKVQRLIDNSGKVHGIPLINLTMDAKQAGLLFDGRKDFSLTEKQITEFFNSKFKTKPEAAPTQQTSGVENAQLDLFDVEELSAMNLSLTDNFSILLEDLKTTPGAIQKMKEDGVNISDLNSLKESFKKSAFTEESQYEEHLRKCYLK